MIGILLENKTAAEAAEKIMLLKTRLKSFNFNFGDIAPILLTDNGGEFSNASAFENDEGGNLETHLFYCEPNSPYEKPDIEKNHTLFRDIVPKGCSFDDFSQETVDLIFSHVNAVKRKQFNGKSAYEILPFWKDSEHTVLEAAIRLYQVEAYEGDVHKLVEKVEIYDLQGVHCFILDNGSLVPDSDVKECDCAYVNGSGKPLNWEKIPLFAIKYNERETPLIKKVKTLQDGINVMLSDFENNMQEDARNTILVLKNYDGTNLGEFRRNLATYGAVKVRCDGDANGGVESLEIEVNSANYKAILEIFKKSLIENAMGYDAKDDRLSGNPNQMNIQSMYSDIDLDANDMETELQAAFEEILWFVNAHLANTGKGNFEGEGVNVVFNRDMLMNETEVIANCQASVGILSDETIIGQHPWVDDVQEELERLKKQKEEQENEFEQRGYDPFEKQPQNIGGGESKNEE